MSRLLLRLGGLALLGGIAYMVLGEALFGGADNRLVKTILIAGGVALAAGLVARVAGRAAAGLAGRSCPRCGRRVARGHVYCDDHLQETINAYRDRQRESGR